MFFTRFYLLLAIVSYGFTASAMTDTLYAYKMGGVERIDGLLYGSEHTLVLFTNSTYSYHIEHGGQISTSDMIYSSGRWKITNDTLTLNDTTVLSKPTARFFNPGHNQYRKNSIITFLAGECVACPSKMNITLYYNGSEEFFPVHFIQELPSDEERRLKYYVPYLKSNLEVDLPYIDSLRINGTTMVPEGKNFNEIGLYVAPAFNVRFVMKPAELQLASATMRKVYRFRKIK